MNMFHNLVSIVRHDHTARQSRSVSQASLSAQSRFRRSMLGESGIHEAVRLFGVGR
jgi:hypothetical protein